MLLEKRFSGIFFTFSIKALTYTYGLLGLAHFTYSASIVWNRKTQRSLIRGRGTYIYTYIYIYIYINMCVCVSIRDYIHTVHYRAFHSLHCLFIRKSWRHLRPTLELTSHYLNIFCMLRFKRIYIQSWQGCQFIKGIFPCVGNGQNAYMCGIYILCVISMTSSFCSDAKTLWATC